MYRINEEIEKRVKTDTKDERILSQLSDNSRTPISAISKKIRLSKEGTFYRIKKLQKDGVIQKFYPLIDMRDFGYYTYHVFIVINEINPERKKQLLGHLIDHPNTRSIMEYSDRWDLEWVLVARNVQEFDNMLTDVTKNFSDIIIEKQMFEIIHGYKSSQFPDKYKEKNIVFKPKKKIEKKIDEKDIEILKILSEDVRMSTYKIGRIVGLSADAIGYRLKKLYNSDVINQFSILPNLSLLGYHWHTMCVSLKTFDLNHELRFKEYISAKPEVIRAVKILGDWELMIHIVTREMRQLHRIVKDIQKNFVDIIISYQTWGGYKEYFFTSLPKVISKRK